MDGRYQVVACEKGGYIVKYRDDSGMRIQHNIWTDDPERWIREREAQTATPSRATGR